MTVKELIEKLKKFDEELVVVNGLDNVVNVELVKDDEDEDNQWVSIN